MSTESTVSLIDTLEALQKQHKEHAASVKCILKRLDLALKRSKITLLGLSEDGEPLYKPAHLASPRDQLRCGLMVENEIKDARVIALNNHHFRTQGETKGQKLNKLEHELSVLSQVLPSKISEKQLVDIINEYTQNALHNNPEISEPQMVARTMKYLRDSMFGRYCKREAREIAEMTASANINSRLITAW
ncbi:hypothetical protein [Pseudoalteromonas umbrosa]|uniref:hypothetical protein n=1 Tax=Pseudoalteromonas umbrosa TaxID=3048489 RepID=UPI0024C39027|nr:hypothetical protein [Pseudoalteromonas sp. B95]MDK1290167.1 hypothetical protein [Pseudoalteromonas sp. B95]